MEDYRDRVYKGCHFFLSEACPSVETLMEMVSSEALPGIVYKNRRRRSVFAANGFLVKKYTFTSISDILHSRRYGTLEFQEMRGFMQRFGQCPGVRVPKLYGYFIRPKWHFFSSLNGVVIEYIPKTRFFQDEEIIRLAPVVAHMAKNGIYHPDVYVRNFLYKEDEDTIYPIDFLGCNFLELDCPDILLLMAYKLLTQFVNLSEEQKQSFLEKTMSCHGDYPYSFDKVWKCFRVMEEKHYDVTPHQIGKAVLLPKDFRKILIQ